MNQIAGMYIANINNFVSVDLSKAKAKGKTIRKDKKSPIKGISIVNVAADNDMTSNPINADINCLEYFLIFDRSIFFS